MPIRIAQQSTFSNKSYHQPVQLALHILYLFRLTPPVFLPLFFSLSCSNTPLLLLQSFSTSFFPLFRLLRALSVALASALVIPPYSIFLFIFLLTSSFFLCLAILLFFNLCAFLSTSFLLSKLAFPRSSADWCCCRKVKGILSSLLMSYQLRLPLWPSSTWLKLESESNWQHSCLYSQRMSFFFRSAFLSSSPRWLLKSSSQSSAKLCQFFWVLMLMDLTASWMRLGAMNLVLSSNSSPSILFLMTSSSPSLCSWVMSWLCLMLDLKSKSCQSRLLTGLCLADTSPCIIHSFFPSLFLSSSSISLFLLMSSSSPYSSYC